MLEEDTVHPSIPKEDTSHPIVPISQRSHELLTAANIVHCSISMSSYTPQASKSGFQLYVQHLAIFNSISFFSDSQILLSNYDEIIPLMPRTSQTDLNSSGHVKHLDTIRHVCAFFKSSLLSRLKWLELHEWSTQCSFCQCISSITQSLRVQ